MRLIREEKTFIREAVLLMLPMILQNFVTFSMSMADTFMVGVLGETALAAVTMANSPFYVMQLMIFGVQSGMSVLVAQYHGRGDQEAINRVMGIALFVSTTITGLLAITAFCIPEQIMRVLTNNADLVAPGAAVAGGRRVHCIYRHGRFSRPACLWSRERGPPGADRSPPPPATPAPRP